VIEVESRLLRYVDAVRLGELRRNEHIREKLNFFERRRRMEDKERTALI
jgi:hypothetical protein